MTQSIAYGPSNRSLAVYKGLKVAVYAVDKTELSLTRTDLIELINVCILLTDSIHLLVFIYSHLFLYTSVPV